MVFTIFNATTYQQSALLHNSYNRSGGFIPNAGA
jgi:hypothetical protein